MRKRNFYADRRLVAIHQPLLFGWLGYYHKIHYSDIFVFHDQAQYTKKSFIKRALIRNQSNTDLSYISIPLTKHSDYCLIKDLKVQNSDAWQEKHLRKIKESYRKAPFFEEIFEEIVTLYENVNGTSSLSDITSSITMGLAQMLGISSNYHFSSQITNLDTYLTPHEKNLAICKKLEGEIYFSGSGGHAYQDGKVNNFDISIVYQDFKFYCDEVIDKSQLDVLPHISILDSLFFLGIDGVIELLKGYEEHRKQN